MNCGERMNGMNRVSDGDGDGDGNDNAGWTRGRGTRVNGCAVSSLPGSESEYRHRTFCSCASSMFCSSEAGSAILLSEWVGRVTTRYGIIRPRHRCRHQSILPPMLMFSRSLTRLCIVQRARRCHLTPSPTNVGRFIHSGNSDSLLPLCVRLSSALRRNAIEGSHSTYIAMAVSASLIPRSCLPPRGCSPPFLPSLHHPDIHCYSLVLIGFTFTPVLPLIIVFTRLISGSFITVVQCKFSSIFTLFLLFTSCLFPLSVRLIHRTKYPLPPHLVTTPVNLLLSLSGVPRITPPSISTYYVHATIRRAAVLL